MALIVCQRTILLMLVSNKPSNPFIVGEENQSAQTFTMVGEMVQNSQSLYVFTFNVLIDIHDYIYSQSTTEFTF